MAAGVVVQALADSIFLNTSLKAFKVRAEQVVTVYDLEYARRLVELGLAAFPASTSDWPQAKAEDPTEVPEAAPVEAKPSRKKGRAVE